MFLPDTLNGPGPGHERTGRHGVRRNKHYDNQHYRCGACGKTFSENVGFERLKAAPAIVTQAIHMWIAGMSLPEVKLWLEAHESISVSHRTILGWAESRTAMIEEYADAELAPQVSGVWRPTRCTMTCAGTSSTCSG